MRFSKEQEGKYLAVVRGVLRLKPDATLEELQRQLDKAVHHLFTPNYISKLRKKAFGAQAHSLDNKTMMSVIAEFIDTSAGLRNYLLPFMTSTDQPKMAIRAIGEYFDILERSTKILIVTGVLDDERGRKAFEQAHKEMIDAVARGKTAVPTEDIEAMSMAADKSGFQLPGSKKEIVLVEGKSPEAQKKKMRWFPDPNDLFQFDWIQLEVDDDGNPIKHHD